MGQKKAVTRELQNRYQKARKKEKIMILDEFTQITGYQRSYAARVLTPVHQIFRNFLAIQALSKKCGHY